MSVTKIDGKVEIFKFRETGMLPLFDEVVNFIKDEFVNHGRRWEAVDMYTTSDSFVVELVKL